MPTGPKSSNAAPLRIAISINTAWNIANFRAGLVRTLLAKGHEVIAIAPPDAYVARLEEMGCRFVPLPMDNKGVNPVKDTGLFLRYLGILRRERPSVFLGYTVKPNVYGSLAAHILGIPVINNVSGLGTAFIRDTWLTRVVKLLYRTALARSARVFFQNEDDRALFVASRLVAGKRTGLLPGSGIDLARFVASPLPAQSDGDVVTFLLIARLLYDKGVGEYAEAAKLLRGQGINARFRLLGFLDVANRSAIPRSVIQKWHEEGVVEYLGSADDVRSHLAATDCIVLPSYYPEGTPRTLLEGGAMGRPIITTDTPGCRNVVEDGVNGFLCPERDSVGLADSMGEFASLPADRRNAMGVASRAKMERQFDEGIVIARYLEAIAEATSQVD